MPPVNKKGLSVTLDPPPAPGANISLPVAKREGRRKGQPLALGVGTRLLSLVRANLGVIRCSYIDGPMGLLGGSCSCSLMVPRRVTFRHILGLTFNCRLSLRVVVNRPILEERIVPPTVSSLFYGFMVKPFVKLKGRARKAKISGTRAAPPT